MAKVYLEIDLGGDAPDEISLAQIIRAFLEEHSAQRNYYCEDVAVAGDFSDAWEDE